MLSRPDPQSFTKFALSAGVFLVIAAFVIPGLILRETGILRISQRELSGLTPLARKELKRRQGIDRSAGLAAPYVGILCFILGGALIVYGAPRLKRQEEADEERFSVELDKLRSEIKPQSKSEHEERLMEDVEEELGYKKPEPAAVVSEEPQPDVEEEPGYKEPEPAAVVSEEPQPSPSTSLSPRTDVRQLMRRAAEVEERVLAHLAQIAPPRYELQANVKIARDPALLLDGLLVSKVEQLPDIVVEIKLSGRSFRKNARNRINDGVAQLLRYRARMQRMSISWLIIVFDEAIAPADREFAARLAAEFAVYVHVSVITLDDLPGLSLPLDD
jgi:hypothetical protein